MIEVVIVSVVWLLCGLASAGLMFAEFQAAGGMVAKQTWRHDLGGALCLGLVSGPVGVIPFFLLTGFAKHGWRLWPKER